MEISEINNHDQPLLLTILRKWHSDLEVTHRYYFNYTVSFISM